MKKETDLSKFPQRIEYDLVLSFTAEYPNSAFMEFDFDISSIFGSKGRIPVQMTVDGHTFRSTMVPMGGKHLMTFNKQMRDATGYKAGDRIHILLERDAEPRTVDMPADVRSALTEHGVWPALLKYTYSHQKEVLDWINDTKNAETRTRRIAKLADKLKHEDSDQKRE